MFSMISWVIAGAGGLMAAYCIWTYIKVFATETGTTWQKLLSASRDSATILLTKMGFIVSGLTLVLDKVATALGDPQLIDQVQPYLTAKNVAIAAAVFFGLNFWARLRTLGK